MLKRFIAKTLVAIFMFSWVLTATTYAGENDIPRMFQGVPSTEQME